MLSTHETETSEDKTKEAYLKFLNSRVFKKLNPGFDRHSVFLTHHGHVYTRGLNCYGQLGLGDEKERRARMPTQVPRLNRIVDVELATHSTFCRNDLGQVYAFGCNSSGQLRLGDKKK